MSTGFFLSSIYTNSHGFSEVWACLCLCHNRKYKVSKNSDETEQDDPLCPWGRRSSGMHLTALLGCFQRHTFLSTIPRQRWDRWGVKEFTVKLQSRCCVMFCVSCRFASLLPLSLPNYFLFCYFPSLKTWLSFLFSMKCSLERVKFILFNVLLLDKHLGTAICLAEVLFPLDTDQ